MYRRILKPAAWPLVCALVLLAGCHEKAAEGPETVPVHGKIEFTKGGSTKDLADRSIVIQFESVDKPGTIAFGEILEDGAFTMGTQTEDGGGKLGVVPGTHRVRLNADPTTARVVAPKFLSYDQSGITVKAPVEGELVIKVWK
jgi:hypothetical protein